MYERFTDRARKVLQLANQEAQRFHHEYIGTEHILIGLVKEGSGVGANVLKNLAIDLRKIRLEVEKIVQSGPHLVTMGRLPQTPRAKKAIQFAIEEARNLNHSYVGTEHLLLGLIREQEGVASQVLLNLGLRLEDIREEVLNLLGHDLSRSQSHLVTRSSKTPVLAEFGRDRTEAVRKGDLPSVVGRQDEITRAIRILCRKLRNNPVLVGEPGVGKSALATGVAERIVHGQVPADLCNTRLIALDVPALVLSSAGFDKCFQACQAVVREVRKAGNMILFIDDLHMLARAFDACGPLLMAIGRREIRCIGATTTEDYRQHIAYASSMRRLFEPMTVTALSCGETLQVLRLERPRLEVFHRVQIQDSALAAAVHYADRCWPARHYPQKAIDLLDESAAQVRLTLEVEPPPAELKEMAARVEQLTMEKEDAVGALDFEKAAHLRDQQDKLKKQLERARHDWQEKVQTIEASGVVDERAVAQLADELGGGPLPDVIR